MNHLQVLLLPITVLPLRLVGEMQLLLVSGLVLILHSQESKGLQESSRFFIFIYMSIFRTFDSSMI